MNILIEKRNAVKRLVFKGNGVSRGEISDDLNLDIRTVSRYLEELTERGLLSAKAEVSAKRGRPRIFYYPNNNNILYPGIFVSSSGIRGVLVDLDGDAQLEEMEERFSLESKLTFFNKIMEHCSLLVGKVRDSGKNVGGIGVAYSRWLQPPISEYEIFSHLFDSISDRFNVPIYKTSPINALLYKIKNLNEGEDNIAIVNPGNILEMGVMLGNAIPENLDELENDLQHFEAFPGGEKCYCGKTGCLENAISRGGILHAYNHRGGEAKINDIAKFYELAENNDPTATMLLYSLGEGMGKALLELKHKLKLMKIYFCTSGNELLYKKTVEYISSRSSENNQFVSEVPVDKMSVPKAAGNMAAYLTIKHHILFE